MARELQPRHAAHPAASSPGSPRLRPPRELSLLSRPARAPHRQEGLTPPQPRASPLLCARVSCSKRAPGIVPKRCGAAGSCRSPGHVATGVCGDAVWGTSQGAGAGSGQLGGRSHEGTREGTPVSPSWGWQQCCLFAGCWEHGPGHPTGTLRSSCPGWPMLLGHRSHSLHAVGHRSASAAEALLGRRQLSCPSPTPPDVPRHPLICPSSPIPDPAPPFLLQLPRPLLSPCSQHAAGPCPVPGAPTTGGVRFCHPRVPGARGRAKPSAPNERGFILTVIQGDGQGLRRAFFILY